jgi:hypothetical protein
LTTWRAGIGEPERQIDHPFELAGAILQA